MIDIIKPLRKKGDCGKSVKNHHWLCDKCWGRRAKAKYLQTLPSVKIKNKYSLTLVTTEENRYKDILNYIRNRITPNDRFILNKKGNELVLAKLEILGDKYG
jgi:protease II